MNERVIKIAHVVAIIILLVMAGIYVVAHEKEQNVNRQNSSISGDANSSTRQ